MTESSDDFDQLGLIAAEQHAIVRIGTIDVGCGLISGNMTSAINQMARGKFVIDFNQSAGIPDYFGDIAVAHSWHGVEFPHFTGSIVSAKPVNGSVEIEALSAINLFESIIPGMVSRGVPPPELIYVLARSSGIPHERLKIQGIDGLPREIFEIVVPLDGVVIEQRIDFGGVTFLSEEVGAKAIASLEVQDDLKQVFRASGYALALVTTSQMFDAEERGLASVDLALAWLVAQLRYGAAVLPDGSLLKFDRKEALAQPLRRDVVFVRGMSTQRQWLRRPRSSKQTRFISPTFAERRLSHVLPTLTLQDELAILALSRAARDSEALARVQALWEAIEFYASGMGVERLFTKAECKAIRTAISGALPELSGKRKERMEYAVAQLNNAPLLARLKKLLDDEGVPIADGEIELLLKLRELRNDVVHGRRSELPAPEHVDYAVSIVSRMIAYRIARYYEIGGCEETLFG